MGLSYHCHVYLVSNCNWLLSHCKRALASIGLLCYVRNLNMCIKLSLCKTRCEVFPFRANAENPQQGIFRMIWKLFLFSSCFQLIAHEHVPSTLLLALLRSDALHKCKHHQNWDQHQGLKTKAITYLTTETLITTIGSEVWSSAFGIKILPPQNTELKIKVWFSSEVPFHRRMTSFCSKPG